LLEGELKKEEGQVQMEAEEGEGERLLQGMAVSRTSPGCGS